MLGDFKILNNFHFSWIQLRNQCFILLTDLEHIICSAIIWYFLGWACTLSAIVISSLFTRFESSSVPFIDVIVFHHFLQAYCRDNIVFPTAQTSIIALAPTSSTARSLVSIMTNEVGGQYSFTSLQRDGDAILMDHQLVKALGNNFSVLGYCRRYTRNLFAS